MKCFYKIFCPIRHCQIPRSRTSQKKNRRHSLISDSKRVRLLEETNPECIRRPDHRTIATSSNCSTERSLPVNEVGLSTSGSDEVSALSLHSTSVFPLTPVTREWLKQNDAYTHVTKEWLGQNDTGTVSSRTVYTRAEI